MIPLSLSRSDVILVRRIAVTGGMILLTFVVFVGWLHFVAIPQYEECRDRGFSKLYCSSVFIR